MTLETLCTRGTVSAPSWPCSGATCCAHRPTCLEVSERQLVLSVTKAPKPCKLLSLVVWVGLLGRDRSAWILK